ncbi:MAG: DedA family protein [Anaerolineales bacterium]|jgi:membrane-associated protein
MDIIKFFIDLFIHLDKHLSMVIQTYGTWTYLLLFFVIFMETGFVVTPFLPGDSLLFAAGTFASPALGSALNIWVLYFLLVGAAVAGDNVNYWIGRLIGRRAFSGEIRFLKKAYLERTETFYQKHGVKTIILARFAPILRTFAPFVAGVGKMSYGRFVGYDIIGGIAWVSLFTWGGYFFGNLPFVKQNFSFVVLAIIFISLMPAFIEILKSRLRPAAEVET